MTELEPQATPAPQATSKFSFAGLEASWALVAAVAIGFGSSSIFWYERGKDAGATSTTKELQNSSNEKSTQISKLTGDLAVQIYRAQRAEEELKKSFEESAKLTAKISALEKNVPIMDARAKSAASCAFIQQEMVSLRIGINNVTTRNQVPIFAKSETNAEATERLKRDDVETAPMRQQLTAYTQRFSECTQTPR